MRIATLFPHLSGLSIQDVRASDGQLALIVAARRHTASCPHCHRRSRRIHSHYWRYPCDMPINGLRVTLQVRVRRFFCLNLRCPHRTFAERFPTLLAPYARRTRTLNDWLTRVAFALGGEAGARLLHHLGLTICGDTLLARIRAFIVADPPVPRILSVDDFAFRRGRIYGTILVDLERQCTIDLLPDRSTGTFATWLLAIPAWQWSVATVVASTQGVPDRAHLTRSKSQAAGILVLRPENRTDEEQGALARLAALHPELAVVVAQWQSFADLLRDRDDEYPGCRLEQWMSEAAETKVPKLKAFVTKLRQDVAAVVAALTLPHSQGQTAGRVNRLKLIKRAM